MKGKIGIVTLHRNTNYGANLQAYALQKYIQSIGGDVQLVDYLPLVYDSQNHLLTWLRESWRNARGIGFFRKVKLLVALCLSAPSKARRLKRFDEFRKKNCKLSVRCDTSFDIVNLGLNTLVCGSDQIWNPDVTYGFDPVYFGEVDGVTTRVSYAASLGKTQLNGDQEIAIVKLIQALDNCSVRESVSNDYLSGLSGKEITTVCDPTLLLAAEDYLKLTGPRLVKSKYVLLYSIIKDPLMTAFAERFARERGLALVEISQGKKHGTGHLQVTDWGPCEFLTAYRDADFIITNSFHGTAFSLIFEKQFLVFDNKIRGIRISNLLATVGLENRMLDSATGEYPDAAIDYTTVRAKFASYVRRSKEFLAQALDSRGESLIPEKKCAGCGVCKAVCPFDAISMKADVNGFQIAIVDRRKCKNCGRCKQACPMLTPVSISESTGIYAFKGQDILRAKSASGGAFAALASLVLKQRGVVYGVAMRADFSAEHIRIETLNNLSELQGTKYHQSMLTQCYSLIKKDLQAGKIVLFSGTACQIAAVKKYVEICQLPSEHLYLVDIICHGVASPSMFKRFILWLGKQYNCPVASYAFRDKDISWRGNSCKTVLVDGRTFQCDRYSSAFMNMYYSSAITRDCCFSCRYADTNRCSDLTIGDYWGIEKLDASFEDSLGVSVMLVNSEKGRLLLEQCEGTYIPGSLETCRQPQLHCPVKCPGNRDMFLRDYRANFDKTIRKLAVPPNSFIGKISHGFFK